MRRSLAGLPLLLVACGEAPPAPTASCRALADGALVRPAAAPALFVAGVTPRYDGGRIFELSLPALSARALPLESTGDTVVRPMGEALAVLHRAVGDQDNLTLFARGADGSPRACQVSLLSDAEARAAGPRPWVNAHDALALDARTVVVARYLLASLAVVDVAAGRVARVVDLAPYAGAEGGAYPDAIARVGSELWVTIQRRDNAGTPRGNGAIVRLDAATFAARGVIELPRSNPYGPIQTSPDGAQRWVATIGAYEVTGDGAVEAIDVATGRALDPVVTEAEVEGNIDGVAVVDARRVALRVSDERVGMEALRRPRVVLFDRVTRAATTLLEMETWGAAPPVVVGDRIIVGDPGRGAFREGTGLRVFTPAGVAVGGVVRLGDGLMPYDAQAR